MSSQGIILNQRNESSTSHQGISQTGRKKETCPTCGRYHTRICQIAMGACYNYGQMCHMKRECPFLQGGSSQGSTQLALSSALIIVESLRQFSTQSRKGHGRGRSQGGRVQKQANRRQAQVFTLTPQDA